MPRTQNAKKNPFHKSLIELFVNVAQINHVASVSEKLFSAQIKQAESLIKKHKSQAVQGPVLGTSTSLPIAAIDESDGIMLYHSYGSIDSFDDRLIGTTKECERRLYAELLCGAFEEAERFIHRCFAIAKFQSRNGTVKFGGSLGRWKCKNPKLQAGTVAYFIAFAKDQNNRKLLNEFSRLPYFVNVPSSREARNACSHVTGLGLLLFRAVSNTFQFSDSVPESA